MRRLVCLIVVALGLAIVASKAVAAPIIAKGSSSTSTGCVSGQTNGYSYSGGYTPNGSSGFVSGNPASPITRTTIIEPMIADMTMVGDHSAGYWAISSDTVINNVDHQDWLQIGIGVGQIGNYYANVPTMYVEYARNLVYSKSGGTTADLYYFTTVGASSGYGHYDYFSIRQETNGTFTALVNGVVVYSGAVIPTGNTGGRNLQAMGEDYSQDAACENQDLYFEMQTDPSYMTLLWFEHSPLDVCGARTNSAPYANWESWNTNYGARRHGNPSAGGPIVCLY